MIKKVFTVIIAAASALSLSCVSDAKNPYHNPDNVKIQEATSLSNLAGTLKAGAIYSCSVSVFLPGLVDTMVVYVSRGGADSVLYRLEVGDSPLVVFPFSPGDTGGYRMQIVLVKSDGKKDSLPAPKEFMVFDFAPKVSPMVTRDSVYFGDSIAVQFHLTARGNNLSAYFTSLGLDSDTLLSHGLYSYFGPLSHVGDTMVSRSFKGRLLRGGLESPLVVYAQAFDKEGGFSAEVPCTVCVFDTVRPKLTLLSPDTAKRDSTKLLDTIAVRAIDLSGIDSIRLNGVKMAFIGDTMVAIGRQVIASLSPGTNRDTIVAWDRARNTDTIFLNLRYTGPKIYPPKIKPLDASVNEGVGFDTLFLDTSITSDDPELGTIAAYAASLLWSVTDSSGNQISSFNSKTRKLVIPVKTPPDSEWVDTFNLNFKVIDTVKNLSGFRIGTFKVNEVPDSPIITMKNVSKKAGSSFDTLWLDTCVKDPDNAPSTLQWSLKNGKVFKFDSLFSSRFDRLGKVSGSIKPISLKIYNRHVAVVPIDTTKAGGNSWTGVDTLLFSVRDPSGLSQKRLVLFEKYKFERIVIDTAFIKIPLK
jgi:hypothetical protein